MNTFILACKLLRRDWRAGEWKVLLLALLLSVASLATVGLFADRVRLALQQQAGSLIGADLRISSTRPLPDSYRAAAQGLKVVETRSLLSMVSQPHQSLLCEIQSVETGYPLRGKLQLAIAQTGIPTSGTIWIDERMASRMTLHIGDQVQIGQTQFRVANIITRDLDSSVSFYNFAPRLIMNSQDLVATGLLQVGSRINQRLLIAGPAAPIAALQQKLQSQLQTGEKIESIRDARPEIRTALERAEHFIGLAALTTAILAGVALFLAARRFVTRHLDSCAVLRCLGASQQQVLWLFLYQLLLFGSLAVLLGCLLGYASQALLVQLITAMAQADLPQPSLLPALKAACSGFALLLGFSFLPLLQLRKVPPLRVLRRELGAPSSSVWAIYGLALAVLSGLFLWQAGSLKLGFSVLAGLLAGLLCFSLLAWASLQLLARYKQHYPAQLRQALANLARHGQSSALQIVALSLGGMALLLLTLVRADLLQSWQGKLPPDAPNRFMVNVQADQQQAVLEFFQQHQLAVPQLFPMIRGRLVAINNTNINATTYADSRSRELIERDFNLSYATQLPSWNELVQGRWWSTETAQFSVEEGIAQRLNIHIGDVLSYEVAGTRIQAKVTSLRKVQWDSMRVNFFVIGTPDLFTEQTASYLSSFYLPDTQKHLGELFSKQFSNVLLIDTNNLINQIRNIMEQIAQVISAVFVYTLCCGLAVLYAAILATQDERIQNIAILRTLGAGSAYLRQLHWAEFAILGLFSGLFAAAGASLLGWVLATQVLEIPYQFNPNIWLIGTIAGILLVTTMGWLNTRRLLNMSALAILRE